MISPLGTLRAKSGLWAAPPGESGRCLILDQSSDRYVYIPVRAVDLLLELARRPLGLSVAEAEAEAPEVDLQKLAELDLIVVIPPSGLAPRRLLVLEFYLTHIAARLWLGLRGWQALAPWIERRREAPQGVITCRPLFFDELEIAAESAMWLPGTRPRCTVVALTNALILRRRGFPSSIAIISTSDQPDPHAFAAVDGHRIDPSEEQTVGPQLIDLATLARQRRAGTQ